MKTAALGGLSALLLGTGVQAEDLCVEVYTHRVSGAESAALNAIAKAFEAKGGKWIDDAVPGGSIAPAVSGIVAGDPMGAAKMQSTDLNELYKAGLLARVDPVAADNKCKEKLPDFVWNAITRDGHVYAAPIHGQSEVWLWDNKAVSETLALSEPASCEELFADLDKIKAARGDPLRGRRAGLAAEHPVPEDPRRRGAGRLPGHGLRRSRNRDHVGRVQEGRRDLRPPAPYDDEGGPGLQWNVAVNMVATGQAAMMVMGTGPRANSPPPARPPAGNTAACCPPR